MSYYVSLFFLHKICQNDLLHRKSVLNFESGREMFAEFGHFRRDDDLTIALIRIVAEITLMIILGPVECLERHQLRHHGNTRSLQGCDFLLGRSLLLGRMIKDHRAILGAHIGALTIDRCRIVNIEKNIEQLREGKDAGIEEDLHHLGMAGPAATDLLIRWISHTAAGIAGFDTRDAVQLLENCFQAPETAAAQSGNLSCFAHAHVRSPLSLDGPFSSLDTVGFGQRLTQLGLYSHSHYLAHRSPTWRPVHSGKCAMPGCAPNAASAAQTERCSICYLAMTRRFAS